MNLSSWFTDAVTVQSQTGSSLYGDPTFGPQRTIKGFVQAEVRKEATERGTVVRTVSMFVTDQPIAQGDLLWLPGSDPSDKRQARRLGTVKSAHDKWGCSTVYEVDL